MIHIDDVTIRRSVSQLNTFNDCSEKYFLERRAKAPQQPAAWFAMGTAIHAAIEEYEKDGRVADYGELHDIACDEYDKAIESDLEKQPDMSKWMTGGRKKGEDDIRDRRKKLGEHVSNYVEFAEATEDEWRILDTPIGKAVELEFSVMFGNVEVKGFIDQIRQYRDGRVAACDLKTGSRIPSNSLQLGTYGIAMRQNLGLDMNPPLAYYWMSKNGKNIEEPMNMWTHEVLTTMFTRFDQAERAGLYLPNPGDQCRTCGVKDACPVMGIPVEIQKYHQEVTQ